MRRTFLVDTNHLSAAINPVSPLRERLCQQHRQGARFRTCVPVICEIEVGIQDSAHADSYRRQLTLLQSFTGRPNGELARVTYPKRWSSRR